MHGQPGISIVLDKRRKLVSGEYPIKLQATFKIISDGRRRWLQKYFSTGLTASPADFASVMGKPRAEEHKEKRRALDKLMRKAQGILEKNEFVTVEVFTRLFTGESGHTVDSLFAAYISELMGFGQVGTASIYRTVRNTVKDYAGEHLSFMEVSVDWLHRFEHWMQTRTVKRIVKGQEVEIHKGASATTVSIHLRCIRKIYNDAVARKLISADLYPFGRRQFVIQSVVKPKHALDAEQKDKVLAYAGEYQEAVDYWVFSYLCNGMNFSDIARLRRRDIQDDWILLDRAKTRRTVRVLKKIEIPLVRQAKAIIARRGSKNIAPDAFVFPVLSAGLTPQQEKNRILDFIDRTNKDLRRVAQELGFRFKFTTYTARHTFANISLNSGASKAQIQEALGHASIRTTEIYTGGFDRATKRKMSERL